MEAGKYFLHNEELVASGTAVITADNRSFRFGDGCFETMKMVNGNIDLSHYHFERLLASLHQLKFDITPHFTAAHLSDQIKQLALKNGHAALARIRLTIFRGDGSLYEYENNFPNYIIQTWALAAGPGFNKKGLATGIYTKARKTSDDFSHIKSNNFLPYAMGAMWVKENKLDDAIMLNNYNHVAEATMANIFLVQDGKIITPALSEGCVNGVMRRYLIECIKKEAMPFDETEITIEMLAGANELFTTNAVRGISWVERCDQHHYSSRLAEYLYNRFIVVLPGPGA